MICHYVQKTCLWPHAGKVPPSSAKITLPNGDNTVEKGKLMFLSLVQLMALSSMFLDSKQKWGIVL